MSLIGDFLMAFCAAHEASKPAPAQLEPDDWVEEGPCQIGGAYTYSQVVRRRPDLDIGDEQWYELKPRVSARGLLQPRRELDDPPYTQARFLLKKVNGPPP